MHWICQILHLGISNPSWRWRNVSIFVCIFTLKLAFLKLLGFLWFYEVFTRLFCIKENHWRINFHYLPNFFFPEAIDKIIHFLTNANNLADRRYHGWSNVEITNALTRIAVNDDNKKMVSVKSFSKYSNAFEVHKYLSVNLSRFDVLNEYTEH